MNQFTKLQFLATMLNIGIEKIDNLPHWVRRDGPLIRDLGVCYDPSQPAGLTLETAVWKSLGEINFQDPCPYVLLAKDCPRAMLYMEIEGEMQRQEAHEGIPLCEAIADKDPRDALNMVMGQAREVAINMAAPERIVIELRRLATMTLAAYEWSIKWFATLQKAPLEKSISIIHPFQSPNQK